MKATTRTTPVALGAAMLVAVVIIAPSMLGSGAEPTDRVGQPTAEVSTSPLVDYLGFGHHIDQEENIYEREEAEREEVVAACMARAGFECWPEASSILVTPKSTEKDLAEFDEPSRNEIYFESLSSQRQKAYQRALSVFDPDGGITAEQMQRYDTDADDMLSAEERATTGCLGEAEYAVPGVFTVTGLLSEEIARMDESILDDPRTRSATAAWVRCLNELGIGGRDEFEVSTSMADSVPDDPAGLRRCDEARSTVTGQVRVEAEVEFFKENREVIENQAVPAGG